MICPVCVGESARGKDVRTCRDCLAESMFKRKMITKKTAQKFCECFKFDHDKTKLKPLSSLSKEFRSKKSVESVSK